MLVGVGGGRTDWALVSVFTDPGTGLRACVTQCITAAKCCSATFHSIHVQLFTDHHHITSTSEQLCDVDGLSESDLEAYS